MRYERVHKTFSFTPEILHNGITASAAGSIII